MANKIMGITIDIEGKTSGLTKSLQDANTAISKTTSALKDVDKALQLDPTNVELMAQKQALLEKQIVQTSEKLDVMKQVADDANEALARGDISQEQYASLTAELSKTDSALSQLAEEARNNADAMEDVENGTAGAADEMDEVATESENAGKAMDALKVTAEVVGGAMAAAFAAAVAGAKEVGEALVSCTMDAAAYSDELLTQSTVTGVSTEKLQELNYAAELVDTSVETITGSMTKNLRAMDSAREGTGAAAEAYEKLGISVTNSDGSLRDNEEVYWEVIDALGQMEAGADRDALAMDILGKSAQELNPLIEAGSETMASLAQEAHDTGYVMSDEMLGAFGAFDDQMQRLNNGTEAAKNALGTVLLPVLGDLASDGTDLLSEFTNAVLDSEGDVDKLGDVIGQMIPKVVNAIMKQLPKLVGLVAKIIPQLVDTLVQNLPLILDAAMQILEVLTTSLLSPENLAKIVTAAVTIIMRLAEFLIQNLPLIINAAIQIIVALIQGLTEALPQLIPTIIEAIMTIVQTLIDNLPLLLDCTLQLILAVAQAILDNLPEIISSVFEIIEAVAGFLLSPEGIGRIAEVGFELLVSLVQKLPDALTEIMNGIGGIIDDILKAFGFDEGLGKGLSEIWDNIWGIIKGVINTIIGGINGMVSAVENAINFIIDAINSLSWDIPDWVPLVGGETFGFDIPHVSFWKIPELAEGAVIPPNNPFLAVLGDQSSGTNIEAPLDTIKQALQEAMVVGGGQPQVINVYIGQEKIETMVAQANTNLSYISGGR
jgi:phage-related protein